MISALMGACDSSIDREALRAGFGGDTAIGGGASAGAGADAGAGAGAGTEAVVASG